MHRGRQLPRLLESFPSQIQGRPKGWRGRDQVVPGAGDGGLSAHGTGIGLPSAVGIGAGGSRSTDRLSGPSRHDVMARLSSELGDCRGTQI